MREPGRSSQLAGLVLAAGAGSRFGGPKALARTAAGEPWIAVAVRTLEEAGCDSVIVVLGAEADAAAALVPAAATAVVAADWASGQGASLRAGLAALERSTADAALVTLVDLPDLPVAAVRRVVTAGQAPLRRAVYDGSPGHPVWIARSHWHDLARALTGDRGANAYLALHGALRVECGDLWHGRDVDVRPMTVVVAPDSFKGTIAALPAATTIAAGWRSVRPADTVRVLPMADGGEGTLDAFASAVAGAERRPITVHGPDGAPVQAEWLLLPPTAETPGGTGVVELATTSGLTRLTHPAPFDAHTLGFGEAIAAALDAGVTRLLLALGGSASTDGGSGALRALGARLLDASGAQVALGNRGLADLARIDTSGLRALPPGGAAILTDVRNPLLGPAGAAAVFGMQKGSSAADLPRLESALHRFATLLGGDPDAPGAGAAGGTGFGLAAWGAVAQSGAAAVARVLGLADHIRGADLVITGEGRFDGQSASGKVPAEVVALARAAGVPVALVAGAIDPAAMRQGAGFVTAVELARLAGSARAASEDPEPYLRAAGAELARRLGSPHPGTAPADATPPDAAPPGTARPGTPPESATPATPPR